MNWQALAEQISTVTGQTFKLVTTHVINGGCINTAYQIKGRQDSYFIKFNQGNLLPMFEAEFSGLKSIRLSNSVRVPTPILAGLLNEKSFLLIEMIPLQPCQAESQCKLGEQLAKMHQQTHAHFGWKQDNFIGTTKQINAQSDDWATFWHQQRLVWQLDLAASNGYRGRIQQSGKQLCTRLDALFADHKPQASLLHGDLWAGNVGADANGNPVIFDPACYYGDREVDLAMTELFGGFSSDFYAAYKYNYPLDCGYSTRKNLYNLYVILNHLNLFGLGYLRQAQSMIDQLLTQIR